MSYLKNRLREIYSIGDCIKRYKGYKVKSPEETISYIKRGFESMGLEPVYIPKELSITTNYVPFQAGKAKLFPRNDRNILLMECGGKGVTPLLSKASGFAELAERFSGYGLAQSGVVRYYLSILRMDFLWLEKRERNKLLEKDFPSLMFDRILTGKLKRYSKYLAKSVCYSLTRNAFFCFPEELIVALEGSNGLASGNTFEEALVHAICEYIESLCGTYLLDKQPQCKLIDRDSLDHPTAKKLMNAVENAEIDFEILDLSFLFSVPAFATIFDCKEWHFPPNPYTKAYYEYPKVIIGVATDPQDAIMRCFTEFLQQYLPISIAADLYHMSVRKFSISGIVLPRQVEAYLRTSFPMMINGNPPLSIDLRNYLERLKKNCDKIPIQNIESIYDINLRVEIERLTEKLKSHKIEIFVHNITNSLLKFPTVRVFFIGGEGYFSKIPLVGHMRIILSTKDKRYRYSYLQTLIERVLNRNDLPTILSEGRWCQPKSKCLDELIRRVMANISFTGIEPLICGKLIEKFYFLGMLYLHIGRLKEAKKCFESSLYRNNNYIPSLLGLAYIFRKSGDLKNYKYVVDHIKILDEGIDVEKELEEFKKTRIEPNPFERCDFQCDKKNKSHLCRNCFFNYLPMGAFMKTNLEAILQREKDLED